MKLHKTPIIATASFMLLAAAATAVPGDRPRNRAEAANPTDRVEMRERLRDGGIGRVSDFGPRAANRQGLRPDARPGGPGERPGFGPAFGPPARPGVGPFQPGPRLMKFWTNQDVVAAIDLTDEQVALLDESWDLTHSTLEELREPTRAAHEALGAEMDKDNPDLDTVNGLVDEAASLRSLATKARVGHRVVVKTTLTAEQEAGLGEALRDVAGERRSEFRSTMQEVMETVREFMADGELTADERAIIAELISDMPEQVQERILARLEGERPQGPGGPGGFRPGPGGDRPDAPNRPERFGRNR